MGHQQQGSILFVLQKLNRRRRLVKPTRIDCTEMSKRALDDFEALLDGVLAIGWCPLFIFSHYPRSAPKLIAVRWMVCAKALREWILQAIAVLHHRSALL